MLVIYKYYVIRQSESHGLILCKFIKIINSKFKSVIYMHNIMANMNYKITLKIN